MDLIPKWIKIQAFCIQNIASSFLEHLYFISNFFDEMVYCNALYFALDFTCLSTMANPFTHWIFFVRSWKFKSVRQQKLDLQINNCENNAWQNYSNYKHFQAMVGSCL